MALPIPGQSDAGSNPFAQQKADADSNNPQAIISKIEDLLDQLKTALGAEEGAEGDEGMAPQTDDEIMAGVAPQPKKALPFAGGR